LGLECYLKIYIKIIGRLNEVPIEIAVEVTEGEGGGIYNLKKNDNLHKFQARC